jgi:hypothetical protein
MKRGVRRAIVAVLTTGTILGGSVSALANPSPPTNGGNGAGQSGQCTGNPNDRPPVCPGT